MENAQLPARPHLKEAIKQALKNWQQDTPVDPSFSQLYLYRKLQRKSGGNAKLALNQLLLDGIRLLQETEEQHARFLHARYLDDLPMSRIQNQMNLAESTLYMLQRQSIDELTATLLNADATALGEQQARMSVRLGPQRLDEVVGLEEPLAQLQTLVTRQGSPWLIALEGIGGIGKTTLALALLHRLVRNGQIDDIAWVSAQSERLSLLGQFEGEPRPALTAAELTEALAHQLIPGSPPDRQQNALRARLKELPHVIVIDNLETLLDIESLLPTLQMWAEPTKFVFTSRESRFGIPSLHHFKVEELPSPHALQLIRQEAAIRGLPVLAMSSDAELLPIVETVGGNPLALRLVVGQNHFYGLQSILYDLRQARSNTATNLYTYIYQKAWSKLDPLARRALLIMPLGSPLGDDLDYLAEVGDLERDELRMALNQLVSLNLVDARGGLNERRYSIHNLTRTFLEEQVARWL